jgi:PAS domain S-box-containing protein
MTIPASKFPYKIIASYTLLGALFGMSFPMAAFFYMFSNQGLPFNLVSLSLIHRENPILYFVDCAPLVLAAFASYVGYRHALMAQFSALQESMIGARMLEYKQLNIALSNEVTERKRIEGVITRAKKEWETSFDAIEDMIIITDKDGIIQRCNRATIQPLGVTYQDILGRPIEQAFFGEDWAGPKMSGLVGQEVQFPKSKGHYEVACFPLTWEGEISNVYCIYNVTRLVKAAEEVQRQKQFFETLAANNPVATVILDLNKKITSCNTAFEQLFGRTWTVWWQIGGATRIPPS